MKNKYLKFCLFFSILIATNNLFGQVLTEKQYAPFNLPFLDYISSYDFADFNNDDKIDVAVVTTSNNKLLLAIKYNEGDTLQNSLGKIDTIFDYVLEIDAIQNPAFIAISDIDNDGDNDFYIGEVAGSKISAMVGILENKSTDNELSFEFRNLEILEHEFVMAIPSVIDIDGDGLEELIISNIKGELKGYTNKGRFQFSKMESIPLIGHDFASSVSFSPILANGQEGLIAYNYENDFQFFEKTETNKFQLDTTVQILRNPDTLRTKFYQPRFKDFNNNKSKDLFLSTLTFSNERGYYTDSWLFPSTIFNAAIAINSVGCLDGDNGQISLNISNGIPPYNYQWLNSTNEEIGNGNFTNDTENLTDLSSGNYAFTITDANGNIAERAIVLSEGNPIQLQQEVNSPTCPSEPTGSILLTPIGNRQFNYLWEDGSTENSLNEITAGTYMP